MLQDLRERERTVLHQEGEVDPAKFCQSFKKYKDGKRNIPTEFGNWWSGGDVVKS